MLNYVDGVVFAVNAVLGVAVFCNKRIISKAYPAVLVATTVT